MENQSPTGADPSAPQQQGQDDTARTEKTPAPRRSAAERAEAGGSDQNARQMQGTQFTDWASI